MGGGGSSLGPLSLLFVGLTAASVEVEVCRRDVSAQVARALDRERVVHPSWEVACSPTGVVSLAVTVGPSRRVSARMSVERVERWVGQALVSLVLARVHLVEADAGVRSGASVSSLPGATQAPPRGGGGRTHEGVQPRRARGGEPAADESSRVIAAAPEPAPEPAHRVTRAGPVAPLPEHSQNDPAGGVPPGLDARPLGDLPDEPAPAVESSRSLTPARPSAPPPEDSVVTAAARAPRAARADGPSIALAVGGGVTVALAARDAAPGVAISLAIAAWRLRLESWATSKTVPAGTIDASGGAVALARLFEPWASGRWRLVAALEGAGGLGLLRGTPVAGVSARSQLAPLGALGAEGGLWFALSEETELGLTLNGRWLFGMIGTVDGADALTWSGPMLGLVLGVSWKLQ